MGVSISESKAAEIIETIIFPYSLIPIPAEKRKIKIKTKNKNVTNQ